MSRYAMLSHHQQGDGNPEDGYQPADAWIRMDAPKSGQVNRMWRPQDTRAEAVAMCLRWTGLVCIPPMRVVDLQTGLVIWQRTGWDPDRLITGPDLLPAWQDPVEVQVRQWMHEQAEEARRRETGWEIPWLHRYVEDSGTVDTTGTEMGWVGADGPWTRRIRGCVWGAAEVLLGDWRRIRDHRDLLLALEVTYQAHKHDPALAHPKGGIDPAALAGRHQEDPPPGQGSLF